MKRKLLLMMASLLLAGAVSAQTTNFWENNPDSHAQPSNTPIVASVQIDGTAVVLNNEMRLGAFVGDDLRGIAAPHDGNFWIQVFYTAQTDNITFKFYNGTTEYTTCATTLNGNDAGYGTPNAPQVLNFTSAPQTITQTTAFAEGWSWWSSYVDINRTEALSALEEGLGNNGMMILYQNLNVENYYSQLGYNYWYGTLSGIDLDKGYKIHTSGSVDVNLTGTRVTGNQTITLQPGWNWIGYPLSTPQTLSSALSGFTPSNNDLVMGQGTSSTYYEGYGWYPDINLTPGKGYLYKSESSESKTLVYTNSRGIALEDNELRYWQNNPYAYPDNAVVIASVFVNDEEQRNEDIEIGAFVNGECRGSSVLHYFEPLDKFFIVLTVKGQDNDVVEFACINHNNNAIGVDNNNMVLFKENLIVGTLDNPYILRFNTGNQSSTALLFPNPVNRSESFSLIVPKNEMVKDLIISNTQGSIIRHLTGDVLESNIAGISSTGVYVVKAICESGNTYYDKLIVK